MQVHLIDGTYELFRAFFAVPSSTVNGREVGAARGLLRGLATLLRSGAVTHAGIAFDHVIESFRNQLFEGYKTGEGVDAALMSQFPLAEDVAAALGLLVWPMVEHEADDALATAAAKLAKDKKVTQVRLTAVDKDLAQCVQGTRVVLWDRFKDVVTDEAGVVAKFGVGPASIPDYLALVGDDADGIPGIARWGAKGAAAALAQYAHLERIPDDGKAWKVAVRGAETLANNLAAQRKDAVLYRTLATLRTDSAIACGLGDLQWRGPDAKKLAAVCKIVGIEAESLKLADAR